MGLIRKSFSAASLGAVDFRSDKERIARSSRKQAKQAKLQTKILREQARAQRSTSGPSSSAGKVSDHVDWLGRRRK